MKGLLMGLAVCCLAACAGSARNASRIEAYDFGLPPRDLPGDGRWSSMALEVSVPSWFDSTGIEYRLLYENPLKLRSYVGSRWVAAPGLLLSQRLRQQLGSVGSSGHGVVNCLLRFELQEFSQVFDTPEHSRALLQGRASLLDRGRRGVVDRRVDIEQAATTPDARGGVLALVSVSDELGRQLAAWLNDLQKRGTLNGCRVTAAHDQ